MAQYRISKSNIRKLRADLESVHRNPQHSSDKVHQKNIDELEQHVFQLVCSIADYDALNRAGGMRLELDSLQDLGLALIKARISLDWSQERLAGELDMPKQQIQRYEAT